MVLVPLEVAKLDAEVVAVVATLLFTTTAALEEDELRLVAVAEELVFGELETALLETDE